MVASTADPWPSVRTRHVRRGRNPPRLMGWVSETNSDDLSRAFATFGCRDLKPSEAPPDDAQGLRPKTSPIAAEVTRPRLV